MQVQSSNRSLTLVFGASGYIGSHLVPFLLTQGQRVRATARDRDRLSGRGWDEVEIMAADALEPSSLDRALAGVDVAYYLVHSMAAGGHFAHLDIQAADHFAAAAARAGVKRIVYLGGLIPQQPTSQHLRSRQETGERLRAGSVPVTEIRAGMIVGPGSAAFEVIRDLVYHLPVMLTPRWVYSRSPPIALNDLLRYLVGVAEHPDAGNGIFDVAGPEVMTYAAVIHRFAAHVGKRPLIIPVPLLTPRLSAYWVHLVTTVPANIAQALIDGLRHDVLADDKPIRTLLPIPLTPFDEAVEQTLQAERNHTLVSRWMDGAMPMRQFRSDYAFYGQRMSASCDTWASAAALWEPIVTIGGRNGYYVLNSLWWLRGWLDRLLGGPGMGRGRRHPQKLRPGDVVDAWRVLVVHPNERLTLLSELRSPGSGVMEIDINDQEGGRRLQVSLYFHPAGIWGILYWKLLTWPHRWIIAGLVRQLVQRAEQAEQKISPTLTDPEPRN